MLTQVRGKTRLSAMLLKTLQPKIPVINIVAAFSQQKPNQSAQSNGMQKRQRIRDRGFLAFYTLYGLKHIDHTKLLSKSHQFDTIREKLLQLKQQMKYHEDIKLPLGNTPKMYGNEIANSENGYKEKVQGKQEKIHDNILRANSNQFFKIFQIGEGIVLPDTIYTQDRIASAIETNIKQKSVFNATSITQQVLKFSLSDSRVLIGNSGIGKTWASALINYLSIEMWKYFRQLKKLEELAQLQKQGKLEKLGKLEELEKFKIQKLVELNLDIFKEIHQKYGNQEYIKQITSAQIMEKLQTFPFLFFLELKHCLTWKDIIKNFHMQCPQIQIPSIKINREQGQDDLRYRERVGAALAAQFFSNMSQLLKQNKNINLVVFIDQANIYFSLLKQIISLKAKVKDLKGRKPKSYQQYQLQHTIDNLQITQKQRNYLSMFLKGMHESEIGQNIKLNCSDQINREMIKLFGQQIQGDYFNLSNYESYNKKQLYNAIQKGSIEGQKQLWAIFWFQIQRHFLQMTNRYDSVQVKSLKITLKNLELRQLFNDLFYKLDGQNVTKDYQRLFTVNFLAFRQTFWQKIANHSLKNLFLDISKINKEYNLILEKHSSDINAIQSSVIKKQQQPITTKLQQQLNQFWSSNKPDAQQSFKQFVKLVCSKLTLRHQQWLNKDQHKPDQIMCLKLRVSI